MATVFPALATDVADAELVTEVAAPAAAQPHIGALGLLRKIITLPSRFAARMRLVDELLEQDAERQAEALTAALNDPQNAELRRAHALQRVQYTPMPGPWGFFTSGYAVGLLVMVSVQIAELE
jgi:hypothetical protein